MNNTLFKLFLMWAVSFCIPAIEAQNMSNVDNPFPSEQRNPNIVIVLSDDQGWGDLSVSGNINILTLKALDIPGSQVMDFRLLMLKRIN